MLQEDGFDRWAEHYDSRYLTPGRGIRLKGMNPRCRAFVHRLLHVPECESLILELVQAH